MTIFDQINSIVFTKKKIVLNCDDESQFSPFMLNRWLSFYSSEMALFVNSVANRYQHFSDKHEAYNFYFNICPKLKFKKINYIKKAKKDDTKEQEDIALPDFLSKKEYNMYVELLKDINI